MTRSERDDVELPEEAESLLADWPVAERDDAFWESLAQKTVESASASDGSADSTLLEPPLPRGDDEPGDEGSAPAGDQPAGDQNEKEEADEGLGLADIARAAVAKKSAADEAEMVKQSLSVAASARQGVSAVQAARARQGVSAVQAAPPTDDDETFEATPLTDVETIRSHGELPVASAQSDSARPRVVQLPTKASGPGARTRTGLVVAGILAVAAALALFVRTRQSTEPVAVSMEGTLPREEKSTPTATAKPTEPTPGAGESETRGAAEPEFLALDDLPTEAEAKAARRAAKGSPGSPPAAAPEKVTLADDAPSPAAGNAQAGSKKDSFDSDLDMRPAAHAADRPRRPSTGAVQAAVASVMTGAQMCLAGQDEPAKATLTFGSNGKVKSAAVKGPAAECIQAALARAKVSPFVEPTFAARFTVRPP
jgi:hypothetical protein